jgi:wyosine [tRNA(Phe)-imidazoG37] synthetase (radical SAM superfamily)
MKKDFKYLYGPVDSWRLGASLGVDLLSQKAKVCSFDCRYCQLGRTSAHVTERHLYVSTEAVMKEAAELPEVKIDYITFSGIGEPTLALNLGEAISALRGIRKEPVAVLTNASLMFREDVREDLFQADYVIAKLDACSQASFEEVNRPAPESTFPEIVKGLKRFGADFRGRMALQIMFIHANAELAPEIARTARGIRPDEVQINTPLRPCREVPLSGETLGRIKSFFKGMNCVSVYDAAKVPVEPISKKQTMMRRGKT